jgi:hypothetical protein
MYTVLSSLVIFPFATGASYYFGGPVLGTVWMGVFLLTCLIVYYCAVPSRTKS